MKVVFRTNIDAYNEKRCFPDHLDAVPRKGEYVEVLPEYIGYYRDKHLPTRLEVVSITWKERNMGASIYETYAEVELWYNQLDYDRYTTAGHKLL
jgi:hypothetical protein